MSITSIKEIGQFFERAIPDERVISQCHVDGRSCHPGGLYFALKGEKVDGHQFLSQAASHGAIAAIIQEGYHGDDYGLTLIRVQDPLTALHQLAHHVLAVRTPFVIGITGSIGKTTVKEFIAALLTDTFRVSKSPSSYNGQIGLPLAILNADPEAEVLVLEMGMSYKNEMDSLVELAAPHYVVITRVAPAHIGHFSSLGEIAYEKSKILSSPNLQASFVHSMNAKHACIADHAPYMTYSGIEGEGYILQEEGSLTLVDKRRAEKCSIELPFAATHLIENFLVAALVAREMGIPYSIIQERARSLQPFKHRFEKLPLDYPERVVVIDDSYNNNPISLKTTLQNLPEPKGGKVIAVIGEMRELGHLSKMAHQEIGIIALPIVDCLICYGVETLPLYRVFLEHHKTAYHFLDKNAVAHTLQEHLKEGDVVLIKGANSNRLWELLEGITQLNNTRS